MNNLLNRYLNNLNKEHSSTRHITLLSIVCIGFLLRFYYLTAGHAYHYLAINDEITAYGYAMRFLAGDPITFYLGQPDFSGGKAPGPYFTLFWILAYQMGGESLNGALLFVLLCNTAVIILVYRFAACFLEIRYALLATALFATAPWVIYYSVGLWNPIPLVILGTVLFLSLWHTATTNQSKMIFWVSITLAIIPHFHMIGLFYLPAVLLIFYSMPATLNKRWLIAGITMSVALYLPYLIGDALHDWQNLRAIFFSDDKNTFSFSVFKILTAPATVLSNLPSRWAGPELSDYMEFGDRYFGSYIVLIIVNIISILFSLFVIYNFLSHFLRMLRRNGYSLKNAFKHNPKPIFIGILLFIPLLAFLPTGHNYATRYTIIIFPILFVILTLCLVQIHNSRFRKPLFAIVIAALMFNIYLSTAFSLYTKNQLQAEQQFMPSFPKLEEIRTQLAGNVNGIPDVRLSQATSEVSELERTLLSALPSYLNIHYQYVEKNSGKPKILLTISPASLVNPGQKVAYRGNGIVIWIPDSK